MTAAEAARALRITPSTLYAYVSRGYIRSESKPGSSSRERRYARGDVERLRQQTEERRDPAKATARALHWGMPILESSITLIADRTLYYRGYDVIALARTCSIEEVASLIWTGSFGEQFSGTSIPSVREHPTHIDLPFIARAQASLAAASAHDSRAFDRRPSGVASCGWRIVTLLGRLAANSRARSSTTIEDGLAREWHTGTRGADLLRAALILCADHELNVSAFAARCVASAGSTPYAVVVAGLSAIEGTRHGGASVRAEAMLDAIRKTPSIQRALRERLHRGESLDGFGHPLYHGGDPRATALLQLLAERYPRSPELAFVNDVAGAAASLTGEEANIDFALAALARVLRLPTGTPLTLFAVGRTIGWIGHALEQYATNQIIRPRAKYVGVGPRTATSSASADG